MDRTSQVQQWTVPEILDTLRAHRQTLKALGVRKLGLFGSYRHGTAGPDSDMDFLVLFERPSFDAYMETKFFLEDIFQCQVDLVLEKNIKPRLRPYILDEVTYLEQGS